MDTKLTLKLNRLVIERAKKYARKKKVSLSGLIEVYLGFITREKGNDEDVTHLVKSISGIIKLPKEYDYRKEYKSHIYRKYSR